MKINTNYPDLIINDESGSIISRVKNQNIIDGSGLDIEESLIDLRRNVEEKIRYLNHTLDKIDLILFDLIHD